MSIFAVSPITWTNDTVGNANSLNNEIKNKMTDIDNAFAAEITARNAAIASVITADITIMSRVYPIGCIYTTIVATNPATIFGFGTWVAFGAGKVLVGLNAAEAEFDTVEETGGAKTPTTSNPTEGAGGEAASGSGYVYNHTHTVSVLQPYITVYFFKRTL